MLEELECKLSNPAFGFGVQISSTTLKFPSWLGYLSALKKEPYNMRIKLTACGPLTQGKRRPRSHAAAYPHRWADKRICG